MSEGGRQVWIRGIPIDDVGFDSTVQSIIRWARDRSGGYVCTPNVDYMVLASRNPNFRQAMLDARLRVPDGMGIVYGSRLRGTPLRSTVTGRLLPLAVAQRAAVEDIPLGLFGGTPGSAIRAAAALRARTGAVVPFAAWPAFGFRVGSREDDEAVDTIAACPARIIFVGLGAPKQEQWMARHFEKLDGRVLVGVGQAIDVLGGRRPAAPMWATRTGLEWAFRMLHEPRRLGRRYLRDDPRFFWWMLLDRLRGLQGDRG